MADKKNYSDILIEDFNAKFDAILEAVGAMQNHTKKIPKMAERLEKLESDMRLVKLASMGSSDDLKLIKIRTEKLEDIEGELTNLRNRVKTLEAAA